LGNISSISGLLFRLSPDEERIAVIKEPSSKKEGMDIWLHEINRKVWTRFTFGPNNSMPVWSPDSKAIAYTSSLKESNTPDDIYIKRIDGDGPAEVVLKSKGSISLTDWSRDGKFIAYFTVKSDTHGDIWILPVKAPGDKVQGQPFPFLQTEFTEAWAVFSPDGRWIAYHSNESGREEIYVRPFPGPGGKWQVSINGGTNPKWRGDGKELFFRSLENDVMSVEIKTSETSMTVGAEQKLFRGNRTFDPTNDGQKFLVLTTKRNDSSLPMTLVVNWLEDLKKAK
jgi:eukaryotic-like serine/threonine-protein kinase